MIYLLLPLLLGVAALFAMRLAATWFVNANPAALARTVRAGGNLGLILVGLLLCLRGQLFLGFTLIAAGFGRLAGTRGAPGAGGPCGGPGGPFGSAGGFGMGGPGRRSRSAGQASTVRTASLEARLDHDTGEMDALVIVGEHEGRTLSSMSRAELLGLWRAFARRDEEDSRLLVEAYLDRVHPEWRDDVEGDGNARTGGAGGAGRGGGPAGPMTDEDAYEVLGLAPGASEAEVRAAHRRLMKQVHPDQGGSTFLAAKLNEAKDVLLRKRR